MALLKLVGIFQVTVCSQNQLYSRICEVMLLSVMFKNNVCDIATIHILLLSYSTLQEDATRNTTVKLLQRLSQAPGGIIVIQTKVDKHFKNSLKTVLSQISLKQKFHSLHLKTIKQFSLKRFKGK